VYVWVAVIAHKYGQSVFVSRTFEGVNAQVHEYVLVYWDDFVAAYEQPSKVPQVDIDMYFQAAEGYELLSFLERVKVVDEA